MNFKINKEPSKLTDWIQAVSALVAIIAAVIGFFKLMNDNIEQQVQINSLAKIAKHSEAQANSLYSLARETAKLAIDNNEQTKILAEQIVKLDSSNIHLGNQAKRLKEQNDLIRSNAEIQRNQDRESYKLAEKDLNMRIELDTLRLRKELKSLADQLEETKDFNRRSSLPNLVVRIQTVRNNGKIDSYKYRILVTNDGLGPAMIDRVSFAIDGTLVNQNISQIKNQLGLGSRLWITEDLNKGTSILPGEQHVFIELSDEKKVSWNDHESFQKKLKKLGFMIYYQSIYGDCCQVKLNKHPEKELLCFDLY